MRKRQTGAFLIGATIAVAVVGILISLWTKQQAMDARVARGERLGLAMASLSQGVDGFMVKHYQKILSGMDQHGNGTLNIQGNGGQLRIRATNNVVSLDAAQIIQAMNLKGVGEKPPSPMTGANYGIRIERIVTGTCVRDNSCDLETLVYLDTPIQNTYRTGPDQTVIAAAVNKITATRIGQQGSLVGVPGVSRSDDNGLELHFINGPLHNPPARQVRNPAPNSPPGILAIRGGYQVNVMSSYLLRDGTMAMTGNLKMGGKAIENASTISGNSLNLSGGAKMGGRLDARSLELAGDAKVGGKLDARSLELSGTAKVGGRLEAQTLDVSRGATVGGDIRMGHNSDILGARKLDAGVLKSSGGVVELGRRVTLNGQCYGEKIALDGHDRVVSCQGGTWQLASKARDRTEVPVPVVQTIVRDTKHQEAWWMSEFTPGSGGWSYSDRLSIQGADACALNPTPLPHLTRRSPTLTQSGTRFDVSVPVDRSVICFSKGSRSVDGKAGGSWGRQRNIRPTRYNDDDPHFKATLKALLLSSRAPTSYNEKDSRLFYRNDCNPGSSGKEFPLGQWDLCVHARHTFTCALPNQWRYLTKDNHGNWTLHLKQKSADVVCIDFNR